MDIKRQTIKHFLATLAYRTQKALRDAPQDFADYRTNSFSRTPHEILLHMTGVVGFAASLFDGGEGWPNKMPSFKDEIERFHETLERLGRHLDDGTPLTETTLDRLLQGPLCDAMTHVGQLAFLRRLHGSPVLGEGFMLADINAQNLGTDQPEPVRPDKEPVKPWQEGEIQG
jgi:hypothetical protein